MSEGKELVPDAQQQKISFRLCAFFLLCALLWNPGIYISLGISVYLPMFTAGALCFPAAGLILFGGDVFLYKKYFTGALVLFLFLILGQLLLHGSRWGMQQIGEMLFWVIIPMAVCRNYDAFRKLLPVYVLAVGTYAFFFSAGSDLCGIWTAGITGNVNWTAALFVMTAIFLGGLIPARLKHAPRSRKKLLLTIGIAAELLLVWQLWRIGSKGAGAALLLTGLLFCFLRGGAKIRKCMIAGMLLCLLAGAFWASRNTDSIGKFISDDGRVIFWENAVRLIADHPLFGVGQGSFENEYMRYRKADYFMILNPASRSNHPHNHLLFMAGSWGLAGLFLWGILLLVPLAITIRKHYRHETVDPLETVCFLTLCYAVLHGCLDLILVSMPTNLIALMCLGILWKNLENRQQSRQMPLPRRVRWISTGILFLAGTFLAVRNCHSALQVRRAYRNELTTEEIVQTVRCNPAAYQANFALLNYLEKRGKPEAALAVTEVMLHSHTPNYPGVHMGRANALMRLGRFREALDFYQTEAELFPLTLRPVYNMIVAARSLKDSALAARLEEELRSRMRIRGNDDNDLRIILTSRKGAHYDLRPRERPRP